MPTHEGYAARFKAFYRCLNCEKNTVRSIDVPDVDDAPVDVDELVESSFFRSIRFHCTVCESAIAQVIAIKQIYEDEEIAA